MQTHLTAPSYPNVAMVQADDYSQQTIERAVRRVFAELEISPELSPINPSSRFPSSSLFAVKKTLVSVSLIFLFQSVV